MAIKIENKLINNLQEQVQYLTNFHEVNQALASWGIRVIGRLDDASELPSADNYEGEFGDAYAIGTEAPYSFYIWTRPGEWFNFGEISIVGPQGPKGDMPEFESSETITISENADGSLEANLSADLVEKINKALLLPSTSSISALIPVIQPGNVLTYLQPNQIVKKLYKHTYRIYYSPQAYANYTCYRTTNESLGYNLYAELCNGSTQNSIGGSAVMSGNDLSGGGSIGPVIVQAMTNPIGMLMFYYRETTGENYGSVSFYMLNTPVPFTEFDGTETQAKGNVYYQVEEV